MLSVVVDTNVLIDAWRDDFSYPRKIIDEVMKGNLRAVASHKIWREYELILDRLVNDSGHKELANNFVSAVEIVEPKIRVNVVKYDRQDNKFFEAAIEAHADYIISNDSHLWEIGEYQGIKVVKPKDFWYEYKSLNSSDGEEWKDWMKQIIE